LKAGDEAGMVIIILLGHGMDVSIKIALNRWHPCEKVFEYSSLRQRYLWS